MSFIDNCNLCTALLFGKNGADKIAQGVFVEETKDEKGFSEHYNQNIKQYVNEFEAKRIKAVRKATFRIRVAAPFVLLVAVGAALFVLNGERLSGDTIKFVGFCVFGTFALASWWVYLSINKYHASIKSQIFPNILSFLGDYKYSSKCTDRVSSLKSSDIIPNYDREQSEDAISGQYKGVDIDLFETHLETRHRSKNSTYYVTRFKGVVISLSMHKNFNGKTIVQRDGGGIGNWLGNKFSKMENVKLEDPRFEKMFEVYADDQIEARYLLTTSFMDRLLQLANSFGSKGIECSFYDDKLLMMIPVKRNLFEPGSIIEPEDFVDDAKSLIKEMNLIFQIIDILKLDQNIGM